MNYEEKLIRYIASKLLQKKYFRNTGVVPSENELARLIKMVLNKLIDKYRKLEYVRLKSKNGFVTQQIAEIVDNMKIK